VAIASFALLGRREDRHHLQVLRTDVAIIGGGLGACAAALAAARLGHKVVLTEETRWIGGQLTSQAVPPDEHPWIEEFGATASYRALRAGIRDYYRDHSPLSTRARTDAALNPGNGWVSRLCHDPRISAWTHGDRVTGVVVRGLESGRDSLIEAPFFIDATPYGDLLDLAGVEHVLGAESRSETDEPHASERADPRDQQAITHCFAMEHRPGEDHTIDKPRQYELWREYHQPGWPGSLLSWTIAHELRPKGPELFHDSVGIGCYRSDLHPRVSGAGYLDIGAWPFQIPLGAMIPVRVENLLPGGKNLGVTHITNGAFRVHPVEWNIGEAAGILAAFCLERQTTPRAVRSGARLLGDFQVLLRRQGIELSWPRLAPV
jgi:hypothetical protein